MNGTFRWLGPALGFVVLNGVLGLTIKLALRHMDWSAILVWTATVYAALAQLRCCSATAPSERSFASRRLARPLC